MSFSNILFDKRKSKIHLFEYEGDEKVHRVYDAPLYFYVNDPTGEFKAVDGTIVKKIECDNWNVFYDSAEAYRKMGFKTFESDIPIETKFLTQHYMGKVLDVPKFDIHFLDIEVHSDKGFPRPEAAEYPITVITSWSTKHKKFFVFAQKDFTTPQLEDGEVIERFIYEDEVKLLKEYAKWLANEHPDILTGWNSAGYDIPYIINRMKRIIGEDSIKKLSPVGKVVELKEKVGSGPTAKQVLRYNICGINCMDLLDAYKKFSPGERESYKLDFIAKLELKRTKIKYDGTLADLYQDWDKYIAYNLQDVRLIRELEEKRGYLALSVSFCYGCRVPFNFINKVTKLIDGAILAELSKEGVILPDVNRDAPNVQYPGGFVKDPIPGLYDWIISFDATSLYPSIMMGWNISPDTKIGVINRPFIENTLKCLGGKPFTNLGITKNGEKTNIQEICAFINHEGIKTINEEGGIHGIFNKKVISEIIKALSGKDHHDSPMLFNNDKTSVTKFAAFLKENNYNMALNGAVFRQDKIGIIPRFVEDWFNRRKYYKKLMLEAKANHDTVQEKYYDNLQFNMKILINSAYGYAGTPYSRFYDFDNAAAVTICGQHIIKRTGDKINEFFEEEWPTHKVGSKLKAVSAPGMTTYQDTDSLYLEIGKCINSIKAVNIPEKYSNEQIKNFITFGKPLKDTEVYDIHTKDDELIYTLKPEYKSIEYSNKDTIQNIIISVINTETDQLTLRDCNCVKSRIDFKREAIIRRAIFLKRKRYVAWVLNNEGINCDKLKCTGVEIVRTSTPAIIQDILEDVVFKMLKNNDKAAIDKEVVEFRKVFMAADPAKIATPISVKTLEKYAEIISHGGKATIPINVRATNLFNDMLARHPELQTKYQQIYDDTKIKIVYMKSDFNYRHDVIGFNDSWPTEFGLDNNIDYERQFEKTFLGILKKFYVLMNWEFPNFNICNTDEAFIWD